MNAVLKIVTDYASQTLGIKQLTAFKFSKQKFCA